MRYRAKQIIRMMIEEENEDKRDFFASLGKGGHYTESQKQYAFELINEHGMRATAKILQIPRRTLQRWCRLNGIYVKRCPSWIYEWVERRRKRKQFWKCRGYC